VDAGVAGGAEGDEEIGEVNAGAAVVDGQPLGGAAGLAQEAVAGEHLLARQPQRCVDLL